MIPSADRNLPADAGNHRAIPIAIARTNAPLRGIVITIRRENMSVLLNLLVGLVLILPHPFSAHDLRASVGNDNVR